ncbi:MAG: hypothetical protein CMM46_07655 [Rhodospirillaceae bacterium]|nr:hypothetical protein [Rhodospirillaceae bacterium]|tara:strand:+ start:5802 stop:6401 length:600 start_codon:yes stop_codon:yes gene_type:complete
MMDGLFRREVLVMAAGSLLAACTISVQRTTWPDITFQHRRPISLGVHGIGFADVSSTQAIAPPTRDIRYSLPVSPPAIMRRWSQERLHALGGPGRAEVILSENHFIEVPLDTTDGVEGFFINDQSERFEGVLGARVEIVDDPSGQGFVEARVTASRTVPENASLNEREQVLYDMVHSIVMALDERLEQEIRANLQRWVA